MSPSLDPYYKWLGIPPDQQPPNHYRLLGITVFETDTDAIASAADQRMLHLRMYQSGQHAELSQQLLNEVAAARVCLLNPEKRAAYDEKLLATMAPSESPAPGSDTTFPIVDETWTPPVSRSRKYRLSHKKKASKVGAIIGGGLALALVGLLLFAWLIAQQNSPNKPHGKKPAASRSK
jgi:hypothetical protein